MKRKKGSKEKRERKGREEEEEGRGGWREGRKEKKGKKRERSFKKRVRNCGKNRFYLETTALHNFSGVPMQTLKERKTR